MKLRGAPGTLTLDAGRSHAALLARLCAAARVPLPPGAPPDVATLTAFLTGALRSLPLDLTLGVQVEQDVPVLFVGVTSPFAQGVDLRPAAARWGAAFTGAAVALLTRAAQHVHPLFTPVEAVDILLPDVINLQDPVDVTRVTHTLAEYHDLTVTDPGEIQDQLEAQGIPSPRQVLAECGAYLTPPGGDALLDLARPLGEDAVALARHVRRAARLSHLLLVLPGDEEPSMTEGEYTDDGEFSSCAVLAFGEDSWTLHAAHAASRSAWELGLRALHAWTLSDPDHWASAARFLRVAPGLAQSVQAALNVLAAAGSPADAGGGAA